MTTTSSESLASAADITVKELRYGDGPRNTIDLYTASQSGGIENAASTRNLIVYVHGGAWRRCVESTQQHRSKERTNDFWLHLGTASSLARFLPDSERLRVSGDKSEHKDLASKLVAASPSLEVAVVNYVISPRKAEDGPAVRHPAHAADVLRALQWLVDPPVDDDQGTRSSSLRPKPSLWLVGHSCGAHILSSIFLQSPETSPSASLVPSPDLIRSVKGILLAEGIYHIDLLLRLHPTYSDFVEGAFAARDSYADVSTPEFTAREGTSHIKWFVVQSTGDSLITEEDSVVMYEALAKLYPGTDNVSKDFSTMTEDHYEMLQTDAFKDILLRFFGPNESK